MTVFRKLSWWLQRRRREAELREELEFHLDEEAEARHADGLPSDQARAAARRDLGNVTLLREETRTLWSWVLARAVRAGRSIRPARDAQESDVHRAGGALAGARDRRQHGDLQLHGRDPAPIAACVRSGVAGRDQVARQARNSGHGLREPPAFVMRGGSGRVDRRRVGSHRRDLSVPGVRTPATGVFVRVLAHLCLPARRTHQRLDQGGGRAGRRRVRHRRLLPRALRVACRRAG